MWLIPPKAMTGFFTEPWQIFHRSTGGKRSVTQLINHEGVCRTVSATPGLLIIRYRNICLMNMRNDYTFSLSRMAHQTLVLLKCCPSCWVVGIFKNTIYYYLTELVSSSQHRPYQCGTNIKFLDEWISEYIRYHIGRMNFRIYSAW